jgi:hypothetical protein
MGQALRQDSVKDFFSIPQTRPAVHLPGVHRLHATRPMPLPAPQLLPSYRRSRSSLREDGDMTIPSSSLPSSARSSTMLSSRASDRYRQSGASEQSPSSLQGRSAVPDLDMTAARLTATTPRVLSSRDSSRRLLSSRGMSPRLSGLSPRLSWRTTDTLRSGRPDTPHSQPGTARRSQSGQHNGSSSEGPRRFSHRASDADGNQLATLRI